MDDDKVEVVRIIYQKVVDKGVAFKLLDEVTFSDSRDEIRKIIRGE